MTKVRLRADLNQAGEGTMHCGGVPVQQKTSLKVVQFAWAKGMKLVRLGRNIDHERCCEWSQSRLGLCTGNKKSVERFLPS